MIADSELPEVPEPVVPPAEPEAEQADPQVALAAVEIARDAALEVAEPGTVGEHLGAAVEPGGLIVHSFESTAQGYRGWHWAVSLAWVTGSDRVTVCDVVMLPGGESIMAPAWVPWSDRLAPGDIGPGDELPYQADDPLLVPGYTITDPGDDDQELFWELGLGRERVVGAEGLLEAAGRWERGAHGPTSETAIQASAPCLTCGYFLPVSGLLRQHFGVCANEWSPADGSVVTMDFGCGAHSQTDLELPAPEPLAPHILDETVVDAFSVDREAGLEVASEPTEPAAEEAGDTQATTEAGDTAETMETTKAEDTAETAEAGDTAESTKAEDTKDTVETAEAGAPAVDDEVVVAAEDAAVNTEVETPENPPAL